MTLQGFMQWAKARRTDAMAMAILYVTLMQAGVGLIVVNRLHAQSQEVVLDRLQQREQTLDARVVSIEQMNLPARLAVLESSANELAQIKLLMYGMFVTIVGSLVAQLVQIRGGQRHRRTIQEGNLEG